MLVCFQSIHSRFVDLVIESVIDALLHDITDLNIRNSFLSPFTAVLTQFAELLHQIGKAHLVVVHSREQALLIVLENEYHFLKRVVDIQLDLFFTV